MKVKPGVHTNDFAPIHRLRALKLGHASLATVFRPGRLALQPILRENLDSPVLRYQPITTDVVTDACLNTRWHHCAYTSAVLRESLGLDRVVTVYVELSRPDWLATVQSGRKQVQSRVCTPSLNFTYIYLFEAGNIYKNPPPNVISPIFFCYFFSLWGTTHDSAAWWSAHISPGACDSFKRVHDWCKVGWRRSGAPPPPTQQKSWLLWWLSKPIIKLELSESCCSMYTKRTQCQYYTHNLRSIYWIQWTVFVYFFWKQLIAISTYSCTWLVILHIVW